LLVHTSPLISCVVVLFASYHPASRPRLVGICRAGFSPDPTIAPIKLRPWILLQLPFRERMPNHVDERPTHAMDGSELSRVANRIQPTATIATIVGSPHPVQPVQAVFWPWPLVHSSFPAHHQVHIPTVASPGCTGRLLAMLSTRQEAQQEYCPAC